MSEKIRLNKWLGLLGIASRRKAEELIMSEELTINGEVAVLGAKIDPEEDEVRLNGELLGQRQAPKVYWMLNKPDRTLSSRQGEGDKETIYDLESLRKVPFHLFSVGRLDYRTEGLLLMSNDGDLGNELAHPRSEIPRQYYALVSDRLSAEQLAAISAGKVQLEDGAVRCKIRFVNRMPMGASSGVWYSVTVYEGRNRLVRRLFEHHSLKVVRLIRYGFGPLRLPENLRPGQYRQLGSEEIASLKQMVDRPRLPKPELAAKPALAKKTGRKPSRKRA